MKKSFNVEPSSSSHLKSNSFYRSDDYAQTDKNCDNFHGFLSAFSSNKSSNNTDVMVQNDNNHDNTSNNENCTYYLI